MIKKLFLSLSAVLFAMQLQAQVLLADTAFTTGPGANGALSSSLFKPAGRSYGFYMWSPGQKKVADDFTIPAGQAWAIDTVVIYGYEALNSATTSPFTSAYLEIRKDSINGPVVFGDHGTNRLSKTGWTGIYRVDTVNGEATQDRSRPIMYMKLQLSNALLNPGHYWMIWHANGTVGGGMWSVCPPKVHPDFSNPPAQNGMAGDALTGSFDPAQDSTVNGLENVGFNFIIMGGIRTPNTVAEIREMDIAMSIAPNPASNKCTVSFILSKDETVGLGVYDAAGRLIRTIPGGRYGKGKHEIPVYLDGLAPGSYIITARTADGRQSAIFQVK